MLNIFLKKTSVILFTILLCGQLLSCAGVVRDDSITDYSNNGFVTSDCFQIIVKSEPDMSSRSLTEKRDSSLKTAKEQLLPEGRRQFKAYILSASIPEQDARMPQIEKEVENYISKGYIVCEYHLEDASSVIVYRVCASNLKKNVDDFITLLKKPPDK